MGVEVFLGTRTGRERNRRAAVIKVDQANKGVWYCVMGGGFMLIIVIKLITARIDGFPNICFSDSFCDSGVEIIKDL